MSYYPRYEVVDHFEDSLDAFYRNNKIIPLQTDPVTDIDDGIQHNSQQNVNEFCQYENHESFQQKDQFNDQQNLCNTTQQIVQQNISQIIQDNDSSNSQAANIYNIQDNINHNYYENNQRNFQIPTVHDIHFTPESNNISLYVNNNISGNHIQYNSHFSIPQNVQNQFNQSIMIVEDDQNKLCCHNNVSNNKESVGDVYNNLTKKFPTSKEIQNQYNYINQEFSSIEVNSYNNIHHKTSTVQYTQSDINYINDGFIATEGIQNQIENNELLYEEEMEEEFINVDNEIPSLKNIDNDLDNVNDIKNTIIRYETVEKNANTFEDESFKIFYKYNSPYYNSTPGTGNYIPIQEDNIPKNDIINKCRNDIIKPNSIYILSENKKVSQSTSQYSQNHDKLDCTIDKKNVFIQDKHFSLNNSNVNIPSSVINNLNLNDEILPNNVQLNSIDNGHYKNKKENSKSRKRQQKIITNNYSDKESSNSECEQKNKKVKIDIKISHRLKSLRDSISLKNVITSNGSEYTDYFCRWNNCDYVTNDVETLYKHVCTTHTTEDDYIYCQWGSCLVDDLKNTSLHIPTRVSMENYFDHMYSHTHMKQFFCDNEKCNSNGFYTKSKLEKHIRECYHTKNIHICRDSLCLTTFTTGKARLAHENKFHIKTEPVIYHCPVYKCNKAFPDNSSLHRHIRLSHGNKAFELIQYLKHKSSNEKQTNKVLGLLTNRVTNHLNEELFKQQYTNENGCRNLLKYYDCLDVCVHKEYNSIKNLLLRMMSDIKDNKLKAPINAFIKKYINNFKTNDRIIILEETFINRLSKIIFKNLKISNYPIIPSSVHDENQEREAELKMTKKFLFKKLEDDEKVRETKLYSFKRTDDIDYTFKKMPDQLTEDDKCTKETIFIEQEIIGFGQPINNINLDDHKFITISACNNPISRRNHEKTRNGINSPTLKNHDTNEFCPGYLIRVLNDYKKYLNSSKGKNFLEYKNKLPFHTKIPEEYNDDTKRKKSTDKFKEKIKNDSFVKETNRKDKKECTVIVMDDTDTEEIIKEMNNLENS
uniref:C2H2-type domain-containing protein n=1 Tax=Strongyloides stercoralis TaxID=6248 RepID=A0A0K0EGM2_STRER